MFCPAGVSWSPGGETGPMAQRVRKNQLLSALRKFDVQSRNQVIQIAQSREETVFKLSINYVKMYNFFMNITYS